MFIRKIVVASLIVVLVSCATLDAQKELLLKEDMSREDVEQVLEDSEIYVIPKEDIESTPGRPHLGVYLVMYQEPNLKGTYLFSFRVVHYEDATLTRNSMFTEGIVWDSGLYIGRDRTSAMRGVVKTHVRKYINDYLAANPKPPKRQRQNQIRR